MDDSPSTLPAVPLAQTPIKAGVDTSEFRMASATQKVLTGITIASAVIGSVATAIPATSKWAAVASFLVTALSVVSKALVTLGYNQGRVNIVTSPYTGALLPPAAK